MCRPARRLSAAGNVSRDTCCPFEGVHGRLTAALQQDRCVCVCGACVCEGRGVLID